MMRRDLRSVDRIRDALLEAFGELDTDTISGSPRDYKTNAYTDGAIDGCKATGSALASCIRHGYAAPYQSVPGRFYCAVVPSHVPSWTHTVATKDSDGDTWYRCGHRIPAWKTGPALSMPRSHERVRRMETLTRELLRAVALDMMRANDLHGAALRGMLLDDWSGVDSDCKAWIAGQNNARRRLGDRAMLDVEAVSAWRVECQQRALKELGRRARSRMN